MRRERLKEPTRELLSRGWVLDDYFAPTRNRVSRYDKIVEAVHLPDHMMYMMIPGTMHATKPMTVRSNMNHGILGFP